MRRSVGQADLVAPVSAVRALDMPEPEIGTTFTGPLAGDGGSGGRNINKGNGPPGRTRMKKSRSVSSFGSLGAVETGRRRGRSGSGGAAVAKGHKRRGGSIGARSVGSFRSLLSSLGGKSDMDDLDDDSSLSSFEGDAPPRSDCSSLSCSDGDNNNDAAGNVELPFDHSRRRRMRSNASSFGITAEGGGARNIPRRRRSTGHLSPAVQTQAEAVVTTAARRRGMKKHLSDSHVTTALDLADDDDIDYIVQLKMMVAEAKSEADAASVHISHLTKQNRKLQQINAHLQERVIHGSARIAELESELQRYKNQSVAASRKRSGNAADAAAGGVGGGDRTNRPAGATSAPLIGGSDLAMSDLKFRVAELERQNRNLRSKLKGSGKK